MLKGRERQTCVTSDGGVVWARTIVHQKRLLYRQTWGKNFLWAWLIGLCNHCRLILALNSNSVACRERRGMCFQLQRMQSGFGVNGHLCHSQRPNESSGCVKGSVQYFLRSVLFCAPVLCQCPLEGQVCLSYQIITPDSQTP